MSTSVYIGPMSWVMIAAAQAAFPLAAELPAPGGGVKFNPSIAHQSLYNSKAIFELSIAACGLCAGYSIDGLTPSR